MKKNITILIVLFFVNIIFAKDYSITDTKTVAIYWDASLSQKEKNIDKELEFLDAYFKAYPSSKIKLVIFNTKIISDENLEVKSSNWNILKQKLKEVVYDGASDFSLINTDIAEETLLFFTDGNGNFGNFEASLYSPKIITVSSKLDINKKFLHNTAFYNSGYYVNLLEANIASAIKAIVGEVIMPRLEFVTKKNVDGKKKYIQGVVTYQNTVVPNVNVSLPDKKRGTITDQYGRYKIAVELGDVLVFSYTSMKETVVEIGEDDIIDVQLSDNINELGPAIVKSRKRDDPDRTKVGNFEVDKRSLGYTVQSIDSDDIGDNRGDVGKAIAGKFSGVSLGNSANAGLTIIRGSNSLQGNSIFALYIVDGIPLPRSGEGGQSIASYDFIDPNNIAEVTVLKGYAATNQYGAEGRNGVILITTKNSKNNFSPVKENESNPLDIEYKTYESSLVVSAESDSEFITQLKKFTEYEKSYDQYRTMLSSNKGNVTFFIECSDYFFSKNRPDLGLRVLSNLVELFPNDTSVLKILAFNLEKHNMLSQAEYIYKQITVISPNLSQAHLDLANTYFAVKKHQKSVNLFKNITANKIKEVNSFEGIGNQVTNDFKNVLSNRNQKWKTNNIDQKYFVFPKYDLRVVVEWSHPQTEFNLQYINPKKQYFTLNHNQEDNKKTMQKELVQGYTSDEYILSDIESGKWFLNVVIPDTYKRDLKYPKFLKVKVFTKFGSPDQKLQTSIINLDRINKNRVFISFKKDN